MTLTERASALRETLEDVGMSAAAIDEAMRSASESGDRFALLLLASNYESEDADLQWLADASCHVPTSGAIGAETERALAPSGSWIVTQAEADARAARCSRTRAEEEATNAPAPARPAPAPAPATAWDFSFGLLQTDSGKGKTWQRGRPLSPGAVDQLKADLREAAARAAIRQWEEQAQREAEAAAVAAAEAPGSEVVAEAAARAAIRHWEDQAREEHAAAEVAAAPISFAAPPDREACISADELLSTTALGEQRPERYELSREEKLRESQRLFLVKERQQQQGGASGDGSGGSGGSAGSSAWFGQSSWLGSWGGSKHEHRTPVPPTSSLSVEDGSGGGSGALLSFAAAHGRPEDDPNFEMDEELRALLKAWRAEEVRRGVSERQAEEAQRKARLRVKQAEAKGKPSKPRPSSTIIRGTEPQGHTELFSWNRHAPRQTSPLKDLGFEGAVPQYCTRERTQGAETFSRSATEKATTRRQQPQTTTVLRTPTFLKESRRGSSRTALTAPKSPPASAPKSPPQSPPARASTELVARAAAKKERVLLPTAAKRSVFVPTASSGRCGCVDL